MWTDEAGVTHVDLACRRQAPNMIEGQADGWLCTTCVMVEVVPVAMRRRLATHVEKVTYGDWRDGATRAAARRRRTLAGWTSST